MRHCQCWENPTYFFTNQITGAICENMNGSVLDEELPFDMLRLPFSSKLVWGSYKVFITKAAKKKTESLSHFMKFVSSEVTLYLCNCNIQSYMEYVVMSELVLLIATWMLDKLPLGQWDYWSYTFWLS